MFGELAVPASGQMTVTVSPLSTPLNVPPLSATIVVPSYALSVALRPVTSTDLGKMVME